MTYDMNLGLLATQALTDLLEAEATQDPAKYREFLDTSAEFCRSVRELSGTVSLPDTTSQEVAEFISAVMRVSESRSSDRERERLEEIDKIQPVIDKVLTENRNPNPEEQIEIAEVLYAASGADFR